MARARVTTRRRRGRKRGRTTVRRRKAPARARRYARRPARSVRRRRNPSFFDQPAVKYGIYFSGGVGVGAIMNSRGTMAQLRQYLPEDMRAAMQDSTIAGALAMALAWFFLKGKNRSLGIAAAFGLMAPGIGRSAAEMQLGGNGENGEVTVTTDTPLPATRRSTIGSPRPTQSGHRLRPPGRRRYVNSAPSVLQ